MNGCILNKKKLAEAIDKTPAISDVLKKLASKVVRGLKLPETFSVRGLDYAAQNELERFFGAIGRRDPDGRFSLQIDPKYYHASEWRDVIEYFGLSDEGKRPVGKGDVFQRLKMMAPELGPIVDALAAKEEIARFARKPENQKNWLRLVQGIIRHLACGRISTLSQLGSDWFADSKKLRSGPLRRQLSLMLSTLAGTDPEDERLAFEGGLIVDNPYTSSVTFFAPLKFTLKDGSRFDYPARCFKSGMAVQLPLETVLALADIEWTSKVREVTTSENAAPFAQLVETRVPCVYTAGYPCLAVKVFLHKLSELGIACTHEGDADLDGFRIAVEVGNAIKLNRVVAADVLENAPKDFGIKLTPEQSRRTSSFLSSIQGSGFRFADDVRRIIERGRWIEQESFTSVLGKGGKRG